MRDKFEKYFDYIYVIVQLIIFTIRFEYTYLAIVHFYALIKQGVYILLGEGQWGRNLSYE